MTEIYCSKCGEKNSPTKDYCIKCGSILRKLDNFKVGDKITSFEDMFTQKHKEQLNEIPLTNEIYELILNNIYETGKKSLKNKGSTALEKVADVVEAYAKWSYKSKGGELGFYSANNIKLDDRLNDSVQIATLIHELSHHLLAEIHEQILMYFWEVEKTYEIEVFVQYILASGTVHLMNEYCAHTVEGRFIPHGYQNYGSFNSILEEQKDELDHDTVVISLVLGNTIAEDIIHLLEHFIDEDLRREIKQQYNKDQLPPSYSQIGMETTDMMDGNSRNELIMGPLAGSFDAAMKNPDFKNVLNEFLDTFKIKELKHMFCDNCGCKLADNATFCSKCGKKIKNKNIYIALILTFILTGLGSIYAENTKKGLALLVLRVLFAALAFFSNIFGILSVLVWVYGFYEVYNDVQIANRNSSPNLINDFKNWNQQNKIIAILIICAILILTLNSFTIFSSTDSYYTDDSDTSSYGSYSYDSYPSHYRGVDTSPDTLAKNDPDSYYDYYEYGDNPDVDDYLESEGYD